LGLTPREYANNLTRSPLLKDAWLYDIAAGSWVPLSAAGDAPPAMMWHGMAVDGSRVLVYGGRTFDDANAAWGRDESLYILQFPERTWQRAPVSRHARTSALQTEFPNSGVVPLRDRLALQSEQVREAQIMHTGASIECACSDWSSFLEGTATGSVDVKEGSRPPSKPGAAVAAAHGLARPMSQWLRCIRPALASSFDERALTRPTGGPAASRPNGRT
jgi:hypothetical protein